MSSVHVGVGHDDYPVIPELRRIEALADPGTERDDQRPDILTRQDLVEAGLLDVQQLSTERQDGLEPSVPALLRGAARRIALDEVDLTPCRIALLAIGQLAGEGHTVERALADDEVARLAGCLPRASRREALLDDAATVGWVLVEVLAERVRDRGLDLALHLGVAELRLGLALELWVRQLDADDSRQAFTDVVPRQVPIRVAEHSCATGP